MPTPSQAMKASRFRCGPDMSLLLDALQRASREKEKLAEQRAAADKAAREGEPATPVSFPPLAIDFGPDAPNMTSAALPVNPVPVEPNLSASEPAWPAPAAAPSASEPRPATTPVELTLDPMPPFESATPAKAAMGAVAATPAPDLAPAPSLERMPETASMRAEPGAAPRSQEAETSPARAAAAHPSPAASAQVAREILGATAKPAQSRPNRRLLVLGGLALLVAVANAAFFLGFLDGFLGIPGSALTPGTPPPAAVAPPPPGAIAAAVPAEAKALSDAGAQASAGSPDAAPRAAASRDEDSHPSAPAASRRAGPRPVSARAAARAPGANPATPVFVAKPAAVNVLDLAYAALSEGRLDEAAEFYNRALAKNPGERDALLGLAYIAHHQGRRDEARAYYQRVLRQEPGHPGASAGLLTIAAEGDLQLTASRAREMAERNPDSAVVMSTLGGILAREGRIAEAQQAYFRALTLEPENALHAYNLAVALDRLHKYLPAQGYYQKALALAEKSGSGNRTNFPRAAAQQRLEQLRKPETSAQTMSPPESGSR